MTKLESLRAKNAQLAASMQALAAAAEAQNRNLTVEEQTQFDGYDEELKQNQGEIARLERLEEINAQLAAPAPRVVLPMDGSTTTTPVLPARSPTITGGVPPGTTRENGGFTKGFGEYLLKVREAVTHNKVDPRLMVNAVTTWAGESVGADGGFALPPQFLQGIMSLVLPTESFLRAFNPFPTSSDILTIPTDEDAPWSATGVTAAKTAEGAAITASKIAVKNTKVVMYAIKSLVHVDEKSLRDMAFLGAYVQRKMGEKIRWKVENYVINGTGENEPLGILNAPGLVSLTDINSTATSIGAEDFMNMAATAIGGPTGGLWICHPLVQPMIWSVKSGSGGYPLYTTDMRQSPGGSLLGSGVYPSEACKALNTTGDIFFAKSDGYFLAFESGGPQYDTTIAFAFDQNLQSFRTTLNMGGAPSLSAKVLRADGTNYTSNLIALTGSRT